MTDTETKLIARQLNILMEVEKVITTLKKEVNERIDATEEPKPDDESASEHLNNAETNVQAAVEELDSLL